METVAANKTSEKVSAGKRYEGGCHCGAVRFAVTLDLTKPVTRCNCTICTKVAQTGGLTKPEAFELLAGEDSLSSYEWRTRQAKRYFCKHCGVHCYGAGHLDALGGDFVSICVNTLDDVDVGTLKLLYWDGRHDNWMAGPRDTPWPLTPAS